MWLDIKKDPNTNKVVEGLLCILYLHVNQKYALLIIIMNSDQLRAKKVSSSISCFKDQIFTIIMLFIIKAQFLLTFEYESLVMS